MWLLIPEILSFFLGMLTALATCSMGLIVRFMRLLDCIKLRYLLVHLDGFYRVALGQAWDTLLPLDFNFL